MFLLTACCFTDYRTQLALCEFPLYMFKAFNSQLLLPDSILPHIITVG